MIEQTPLNSVMTCKWPTTTFVANSDLKTNALNIKGGMQNSKLFGMHPRAIKGQYAKFAIDGLKKTTFHHIRR